MTDKAGFLDLLTETLRGIDAEGLMKRERQIQSAQGGISGSRGATC